MKNTYSQHQYKCPAINCGAITKHYAWSKDLYTTTQTCICGCTLTGKNLCTTSPPAAPAIRTPTKNR